MSENGENNIQDNSEKVQRNISENGRIIIKKEAFRNMITHVLRFGSVSLEKSVEVMGLCIGELSDNQKDIILVNAIPVTHGKEISAGFKKEEYDLLTQLEKQYQKKNLNIVGWYSSHPGWGIYFSEISMKTHQFFQKDSNPNGFYIVFDHTLMDKDKKFGLEIYRFDDYKKADKYHNVEFEIELPATLDYFKWVQKFIEDLQKQSPILIKEINETKESIPGELQEIPTSDEMIQEEELDKFSQLSPIISGFQEGMTKSSEMIIDTLKSQIGDWTDDFKQGSLKGTEFLRNSISKMKDSVSQSLIRVENWFKKNLDNITNEFKEAVYNYVDRRVEVQSTLENNLVNVKNDLYNDLNSVANENLKYIRNEIDANIKLAIEKVHNSDQLNSKIKDLIMISSELSLAIENELNTLNNKIEESIEMMIDQFETNFNGKIEKMSSELQPFKNYYSEINELLEKLQKIITDFRNI
ncbi:MAG: hypothetical protein ACFFA6_01120 [Promethearchaeota archaeon]